MPVLREGTDRCTPTLYIKGHGRSETGRLNGRRSRKAERWPLYRRLDGLRILMIYCIEYVCKQYLWVVMNSYRDALNRSLLCR